MKKLGKKLSLNKETIRELTDSELGQVAGADPTQGQGCTNTNHQACPTAYCTQIGCTISCPSVSQTSCICASGDPSCPTAGCCG